MKGYSYDYARRSKNNNLLNMVSDSLKNVLCV